MHNHLDNDWKAKIARNYFAITWNGKTGCGVADGEQNFTALYQTIDETFHEDYVFAQPDGTPVNQGTDVLKQIMTKLTAPLKNMRLTSFDIITINEQSVTFQSTAVADKKDSDERYVQYLKLTYIFEYGKVRQTIKHYHTNYDEV